MTWTTTLPTVQGWYWMRREGYEWVEFVVIDAGDRKARTTRKAYRELLPDCLFAGPIPRPGFPTTEEIPCSKSPSS